MLSMMATAVPPIGAALALLGPLGPTEILLLLLLLALIFGARRLPEIGRGLGEGIRNFRGSMKEISKDSDGSDQEKS